MYMYVYVYLIVNWNEHCMNTDTWNFYIVQLWSYNRGTVQLNLAMVDYRRYFLTVNFFIKFGVILNL